MLLLESFTFFKLQLLLQPQVCIPQHVHVSAAAAQAAAAAEAIKAAAATAVAPAARP